MNPYIKDLIKIGVGLVVGAVVFNQFNGCEKNKDINTQKVEVVVPEKSGKIEKPIGIVNHRQKDSIVYRKGQTVYTDNPINKKLAEDYIKAQKENDSLKTFRLYVDAIQEREQERTFDNKDVTVKVRTKVRGELLEQDIKYTVKEQTIKAEVPYKPDNFGIIVLGGIGQNQENKNLSYEVGAGIRVKKISVMLKADTNKNIGIGIIKEF